MEIEGRVALVTGGARRVGRAITLGLARAGADVVINHHASAAAAGEVATVVRAGGGRALPVLADISTTSGVTTLIDAVHSEFGRLDILVNNASVLERAPFAEITEADFDRVIGINLRAPFFLAQAASPLLREHGGVIINIADLSARQAWPNFAHHAVSKAGLVHLSRVLARALAPQIRVNCIIPGTVLPPEGFDGEDYAGGVDRRVVEHEGSPDDVVETLLWLVRSDFVTGQAITVDGGRMLL